MLTLCLLVSSADNFCKQIGPRSGPLKRWYWSESKLFDTQMVFLKEFFEKLILKKISRRQKGMNNFPGGQRVKNFMGTNCHIKSKLTQTWRLCYHGFCHGFNFIWMSAIEGPSEDSDRVYNVARLTDNTTLPLILLIITANYSSMLDFG